MKPASFEATPPMLFHQVFRQGKLEADRKPNYICKTKFHCPPCSKDVARSARSVLLALLGGYISLRSEDTSHSARRVHSTPLGGCISLRSEGALHSARRVHLTPLGGYIPLCWEDAARPARRVSLVLLEECRSSCSKRIARPARSVSLTLLGGCRSESRKVCKYHKIRKVFQECKGQIPCRNWGLFCRIRC